ncbi:hypothetical protein NC653_000645 [Populus alba x Populus x berolinensis]|uniref:Uncharacterized protein n=2 Tax=Populus alba x Populus x berolinensis TaxID=444605 RepID=A0AAD6RJJ0_9ROSI|nr:hypothetical protein NC653_000645 [Populus alba x Populus x berolinensis]
MGLLLLEEMGLRLLTLSMGFCLEPQSLSLVLQKCLGVRRMLKDVGNLLYSQGKSIKIVFLINTISVATSDTSGSMRAG